MLLLDGAIYHKNADIESQLWELGMQVIYTAPYSYDASPCELFFAQLKS